MPYNPNIPNASDFISDSQPQIKGNFAQLDTSFGVNHVKYSTIANNGKHTKVEMANFNVKPPGLAAFEGTIYTKSDGTQSQLFYTPDNTANEYQLTKIINSQFATFGKFVNNYTPQGGGGAVGTAYDAGWTFLPGQSPGLVQLYGRYSVGSGMSSSGTVKFPITIVDMLSLQMTLICESAGTSNRAVLSYTRTTANTLKFEWNLAGSSSDRGDYRGFFWQVIASIL
jgi:hypothetical protein